MVDIPSEIIDRLSWFATPEAKLYYKDKGTTDEGIVVLMIADLLHLSESNDYNTANIVRSASLLYHTESRNKNFNSIAEKFWEDFK